MIIAEGFAFTVTEADERRILRARRMKPRGAQRGEQGNNGNGQSLDDDRARDGGEGLDVDFRCPRRRQWQRQWRPDHWAGVKE